MRCINSINPFSLAVSLLTVMVLTGLMLTTTAATNQADEFTGQVVSAAGCLRRSLLIGQLHPYNRGGHEESHPPVHLSHEPDRWDGVRYLRV